MSCSKLMRRSAKVVQLRGSIRAVVSGSDEKRSAVGRTQRSVRQGTLIRRAGPKGDMWIAKWRDGGRQVQRGLGFVHSKRHPAGLTRAAAEAAFGMRRSRGRTRSEPCTR